MLQSIESQRVGHNLVTEQQLSQAVSMGAETNGDVILIFLKREFQRMRDSLTSFEKANCYVVERAT